MTSSNDSPEHLSWGRKGASSRGLYRIRVVVKRSVAYFMYHDFDGFEPSHEDYDRTGKTLNISNDIFDPPRITQAGRTGQWGRNEFSLYSS